MVQQKQPSGSFRYHAHDWPRVMYTLTDHDREFVEGIATARNGGKPQGIAFGKDSDWWLHRVGATGEFIVAKLTGGTMDLKVYKGGNKSGKKVTLPNGVTLDVHTRQERGFDYALKTTDAQSEFRADYGALVWPAYYPDPLSHKEAIYPPDTWEVVAYISKQTFCQRCGVAAYRDDLKPRAFVTSAEMTPFFYFLQAKDA